MVEALVHRNELRVAQVTTKIKVRVPAIHTAAMKNQKVMTKASITRHFIFIWKDLKVSKNKQKKKKQQMLRLLLIKRIYAHKPTINQLINVVEIYPVENANFGFKMSSFFENNINDAKWKTGTKLNDMQIIAYT